MKDGRDNEFPCERKVRVSRELYEALQAAQARYQVPGGVSGIVRRAVRSAAVRGGVAGCATRGPATRGGSTVLTVYLPEHLATWVDAATGGEIGAAIRGYLERQRPGPAAPVPAEILAEERRLHAQHQVIGTVAVVEVAG